jgi:1,4-alpha-glucan branching enzyme
MELLPLQRLGAREVKQGVIEFGVFLPEVSEEEGNLIVKVIHEKDQFLQEIQPMEFGLLHSIDPKYGDYWSTKVEIKATSNPKSAWGSPGRYLYRYCLRRPAGEIDWIIDPFAREFGVGKLSAFTLGYDKHIWSKNEESHKVPPLEEIVIYELMINEFAGDIDGMIKHLDYLADLGINCLEIMPVSNVDMVVDWGFLPIGYFGIDERFGKRRDFQRLIDASHKKGIAVILDVVYGHASTSFPYCYLYRKLGYHENPFMGAFAKDYFGESTDFAKKFVQDFFFTVNHHWLDCYHIDGFRYDCVPNYWDGAEGKGYANLVYHTYQLVKEKKAAKGHWQRFFDKEKINLIQCAEQLEGPKEILRETYSNCTWQNETLGAVKGVAGGDKGRLTELGFQLGLADYPSEITVNCDKLKKTAFQYIENHDHSRFICNFGKITRDNELLQEGNRDLWYKLQPYLIAMFTAKGIPMLWQGQEFGENYYIPEGGYGRVMLFRPVRWDYFYDPIGKSTVSLTRKLIKIRKNSPQFLYGSHYFYNNYDSYQSKNLLLFSRQYENKFSLIALNFGCSDQTVPFWFPISGNYAEELHVENSLINVPLFTEYWLTIPSNYGRIWTIQGW